MGVCGLGQLLINKSNCKQHKYYTIANGSLAAASVILGTLNGVRVLSFAQSFYPLFGAHILYFSAHCAYSLKNRCNHLSSQQQANQVN